MRVIMRNPRQEVEVPGPISVVSLLGKLNVKREAVLVIVDGTLVTVDATVEDSSTVEIRPVISGGST
jgi:sulfur carrier protein ThiS